MHKTLDLKELEKKAFRATFQDGLWDILIGLTLLLFMVAPLYVSRYGFGDFWSSILMLPIYLVAFALVKVGKNRITAPRLGTMKIGEGRKRKLKGLNIILVLIVILGIIAGLIVFRHGPALRRMNWIFPGVICFVFMFTFSFAAVLLNVPRFLFYGTMVVILVPIGEVLFLQGYVAHHGYPLVFGITSLVIVLTGIAHLVLFLQKYRLPTAEENHGSN